MKLQFLILSLLCFAVFEKNIAQCNNEYFAFEEGTKYEMTHYDAKGRVSSMVKNTINFAAESSTGGYEIQINSVVLDKDGDEVSSGDFLMNCKDDVITLDINSLVNPGLTNMQANAEISISGAGAIFPPELTPGETLPDGETEIEVSTNGVKFMTIRMNQSNRRVVGKKKITTKAGTFDCVEINYDFEVKMLIRKTFTVKEWFAKGVGLVKSETYDKKDKLESSSELTAFSK